MRKSKSTTSLNRRRVVLAGGALLGLTALPNETAAANDPGLAPAADLLAATRKLLSSLDGDQRKAPPSPGTGRNGTAGTTSAASAVSSSPACGSSR